MNDLVFAIHKTRPCFRRKIYKYYMPHLPSVPNPMTPIRLFLCDMFMVQACSAGRSSNYKVVNSSHPRIVSY